MPKGSTNMQLDREAGGVGLGQAGSGQQAKSERRILTPHVAHRPPARAKTEQPRQTDGWTRWILATFTSRRRLSLLPQPPALPRSSMAASVWQAGV